MRNASSVFIQYYRICIMLKIKLFVKDNCNVALFLKVNGTRNKNLKLQSLFSLSQDPEDKIKYNQILNVIEN